MANLTTRIENGPQNRSLSPWRGSPISQLRREMDDLFGRFFGNWLTPWEEEEGWTRPWNLDVTTEGNEMTVRAEVPGFDPNDLDVRVQGDLLMIRAERKQEGDQQRSYNRFEEAVRIPAGTDPDKIQAAYRNGVLELRLPLPEGAQGKRIPIRAENAPAGQEQGQKKETAKK